MSAGIRITRIPYEEPYHLCLVMRASNGPHRAEITFYVNAKDLIEWADHLEVFPRHRTDVFLWEVGSERPEDSFAHYVRLRAFIHDSSGHCAIHLRFNNNQDLPDREIAEFCIRAEASQINHLGRLCRGFAELRHELLDWCVEGGQLYVTPDEVP
jgi:hypothetical protein